MYIKEGSRRMKIGRHGKLEKETQDYFADYINDMDLALRDNFVRLYITTELEKQRKRRNRRWVVLAVVLIVAMLVLTFVIFTGDTGHGIMTGQNQLTMYGTDTLKVRQPYVGELHIEGEITNSGSATSTYDQEWLLARVEEMRTDDNNRGILLYIDTPGGSSYATDELYTALKDYEQTTKRPVYAYIASEGASGGYYIACAAKRIVINRDGWAGSIGVTSGTIYDLSGLMKKLGIKSTTIHAGKNKTMGSYTQPLTAEQKRILQGLIDDAYSRFVSVVAENRGMTEGRVRKLADGRVYTASQSKHLDLVDAIGTLDDAKLALSQEKGLCTIPVLDIRQGQTTTFSLTDLLGLRSSLSGTATSGSGGADQSGTSTSSNAADSTSSASGAGSATAQEIQLFQQLMQQNGKVEVLYLAPER